MIYFVTFSFIIMYLFLLEQKQNSSYSIVYLLPIMLILFLLLSLQHQVGSDYESYISMVLRSTGLVKLIRNREYLFVYLVHLSKFLNLPQLIFAFSALIQITFLTLIVSEIKKLNYKLSNFFFLYFALSLTFFNQFNGIRQYIAVYIFVYALLKLLDGKNVLYVLLIILATLFHSSSIFLLVFLVIKPFLNKKFTTQWILITVTFFFVLSWFDLSSVVKWMLSFTPYKSYAVSSYFKRTSMEGIITKIPKILITVFTMSQIDNNNLSIKEKQLFNLSFLSIIILILSFASSIIWRFYQYFDLLIIFPTLFYFKRSQERELKLIIIFALVIMLLIKILIIPSGEYFYNSILF